MRVNDILLTTYVDGLLSPEERDKVEREIERSPELRTRAERMRAARLPYEDVFAHQKVPPVPASLVALIDKLARSSTQKYGQDNFAAKGPN
jgi:anti-sigma factor RsiW